MSVNDIINELASRKEKTLNNLWKELKKNKVKPVSLQEKYENEVKEKKLQTGCLIDDLIGGGLEIESSMLLFGEFGSGKTQTCFTMAVLCPDIVVYIDTEGSFKASRIKEIAESRGLDYKKIFEKIILYQPTNWIEQMCILDQLPAPTDVDGKIGLIIVDSLTKRFRGVEFAGRQSLTIKQPLIREYIFALESLVKLYGSALIYTTQIYESPTSNPFLPNWTGQKAVGGASLLHQPDYVIFLRKGQGSVRIARLLDASWQPLCEKPFMISEKGIIDLPKTQKAEKLIEKTEKYGKKQTTILDDAKRKRIINEEVTEEEIEEEVTNGEI